MSKVDKEEVLVNKQFRKLLRKSFLYLEKCQRLIQSFIVRSYLQQEKPKLDNSKAIAGYNNFYSPSQLIDLLRLYKILNSLDDIFQLVDLGSGDGTVLHFLHKRGFKKLIGIEIEKSLYKYAVSIAKRNNLAITYFNLDVLKYKVPNIELPYAFIFYNSFHTNFLVNFIEENRLNIRNGSIVIYVNDTSDGVLFPNVKSTYKRHFFLNNSLNLFLINGITVYTL